MKKNDLFSHLGVYVDTTFISKEMCNAFIQEATTNQITSKVGIVQDDDYQHVNESIRDTLALRFSKEHAKIVMAYFQELQPKLDAFFSEKLVSFIPPNFLGYKEGHFFKPHKDRSDHNHTKSRKITAILFLNSRTKEQEEQGYTGGELCLYGLNPQRPKAGFTLPSAAGVLVAFSSDVVHEVTPVLSGARYSVVTWYH